MSLPLITTLRTFIIFGQMNIRQKQQVPISAQYPAVVKIKPLLAQAMIVLAFGQLQWLMRVASAVESAQYITIPIILMAKNITAFHITISTLVIIFPAMVTLGIHIDLNKSIETAH